MEPSSTINLEVPVWQRVIPGASVALLIAVALAVFPGSTDIYNVPKFFLFQGGALGLFLLWLTKSREKGRFPLTLSPLSLPLLLFFLWGAASLLKSQNPYAGGLLLFRLALFILFFHLLLDALNSELRVDDAIQAIVIAAILVSIYGLLQGWGIDFIRLQRRFEPVSTLGNTSYAAEFLILTLPLCLTRFLVAPSLFARLSYLLSFWLLTFYLFRTSCRGGWLAATGSLLFMGVVLSLKIRRRPGFLPLSPRVVYAFLVLALLLLGVLVVLQPEYLSQGASRIKSIFDPSFPTNRLRLLIWKGTLQMISQHPWVGVGLGNFEYAFPRFRSLEEWLISERLPVADAHNDYLHLAAEMGIPGLLLFLWLIFSVFVMAARIFRRTASPVTYLRSLTLSASLVAILLYALFAFPLRNPVPSLYFWAFLAYLSAEDKLLSERHSRMRKGVSYLIVWPIALTLLAFSYPLTLQWLRGDLHLRKARTFLSQSQGDLALSHYRDAIYHYFPYHHQHKLRSISLDEHRLQSQLIDQYRIALLSEPNDARLHLELGNALLELGRLEEALSETKKAITLDQELGDAQEKLGLIYLRMNDLSNATAEFGWLIDKHPDSARAHFFMGIALYRRGLLPEARRAWESALRLDPSLTGAENLLQMTAQGRN